MIATCIYTELAKGKIDRLYLLCLPFGYLGIYLLLHFGTNLSVGYKCVIAFLVGDAPGALLTAVLTGLFAVAPKPKEYPNSIQNRQ